MIYNIDFLIASLVFLLIILHHFMEQQTMDLDNNRSFLWLVVLGIVNIFFDLICTVLITLAKPELAAITRVCVSVLYLLQILVPHALFCHIYSYFASAPSTKGRWLILHAVPIMMLTALIFNLRYGFFFSVEASGLYVRGPAYHLMFLLAGGYLFSVIICTIIHASVLDSNKIRAVWELVFFTGATVLIQSIWHDVLLSGFGITLGITVLFFTLNNPYNYTDTVTSTFDIRYFRNRCGSLIQRGKAFHLLSVELSQLKKVNLILGTDVGNRLLIDTAQLLRSGDKHNLVFRISGKRFVVLTTSVAHYELMRKKIMEHFSSPINLNGEVIRFPAVICGIIHAEQMDSSNTLLSYIGHLASLAPKVNETRLIQGNDETLKGFRYNQEVESYLNLALAQDRFEVYYQPVYSLTEKKYVSLEALSRLRHPTLGPVSPDVFITIAEKNDQIARIGLLQVRRVCRFLTAHPEVMEHFQSVKINLSPAELMKNGHADMLLDTIRQSGIPTSFFQFEITETVATEYSEILNQTIDKFTKADIGLCLDDFGSGFANLNTVLKLPFRIIKLDRSLLFGICQDRRTALLYQSLVSALHHMGFRIIAEGIETTDELALVSKWGVDMIQGYYFSRPVSSQTLLTDFCGKSLSDEN